MLRRNFGETGIEVSALGFGALQIGNPSVSDSEADRILQQVLDLGITLLDTAPGYQLSEERMGRFVASRREEFILSTKLGYGVEGIQDWTALCILEGVDQALKRLRTDTLDLAHFHSCGLSTLQQDELIEALLSCVDAGKVRVAAYSGENEALEYAVNCDHFGCIQTSLNLFDQRDIKSLVPQALDKGMGVIAKRPLANAPWRFSSQPVNEYAEPYWLRMQKMSLKVDIPWDALALRFAVFHTGAHVAIAGSTKIDHMKKNVAAIASGPLPEDVVSLINRRFEECDENWQGEV